MASESGEKIYMGVCNGRRWAIYDSIDPEFHCRIHGALSSRILKFSHGDDTVFNAKEKFDMQELIFSIEAMDSPQESVGRLVEMVKDIYRCV